MKRVRVALVALVLGLSIPTLARADEWVFFDPHPIHPAVGGGFCELGGAHVHDYAPVDPGAFVLRDGLWFFVGDPVAFGYRGTVYRFDGTHEVTGSEGFAACTRSGVHYHLYAPAMVVGPDMATVYVSPFWWDDRPRRRMEPRRPHAFPVEPPPDRRYHPAIGPPAARAGAWVVPVTPRRAAPPAAAPPPPPARAARRRP